MEEDDLILCTVEKVTPTVVFVNLPDGEQATIISSEIAPGRIKNMRAHVVPNKKIVCKVLRVSKSHIDLSLRRVTAKERKEVMQEFKQEQTLNVSFNQLLDKDAEKTKTKILKSFPSITKFAESARQDEKIISKYIPKAKQEQIKKIIERKRKQVEVKKILNLKCLEADGVKKIKNIFSAGNSSIKVIYISAGKFQLTLKAEDYKKANKKLDKILDEFKQKSKQNACEFEVSEKK